MLPNPLSAIVAETEAAAPPQLRLAARSASHPDQQMATVATVIHDAVHQSHSQWRSAMDAVKETLATLERGCESALEAQEAGLAGLIETLVQNAAAEADSAAAQTRAQAEVEIAELQQALTELQTTVGTLQTDLDAERESVKSINAQLDMEAAARVRAETERDDARRHCQQQLAAVESQVTGLRSELDAQKAELSLARQQLDESIGERAKLLATVQMVQRALTLGTSANLTVPAREEQGEATGPEYRQAQLHTETGAAPEASDLSSGPVVDAQVALAEKHPEAVEDIKRVLDQVEAMYELDLNSGRSGLEVVDSLAASLRYARDVIVGRWHLDGCDAEALFEHQVGLLLHTRAATSFGRHLSIAAYASRQPAALPLQVDPGSVPDVS